MTKHQSRIDQLITELCRNGVEFKELGELGYFYGGLTGKSKEDFSNGTSKYVSYMNVYSNISVNIEIEDFVKLNSDEKQNAIEYGDILFTGSSETPDECGMSSVLTTKLSEPLYLNSFCFGFRLNDVSLFNPEFLKHLFRGNYVRKQIANTASGVTRFNVSKKRFAKIKIPVPPLEIQDEIVNILNKFTELESELESELEARVEQYEYYRENLLDYNANVEHKTLGDSFSMLAGHFISANNISNNQDDINQYPCFGGNGFRGYVSKKSHEGRYVLIGRQGALCGNTKRVDGKFYATEHAIVVTPKNDIDINWAFHMLTYMNLNKYASKSAQPGLAVGNLEKVMIKVPKLSEQRRIASILDKFDSLVNDITIGLPAELNARHQQYEYYRNKLLTFKEYVG